MKKIILGLMVWSFFDHLGAQVIYLSATSDKIFKLNIESCEYEFVVQLDRTLSDITFHTDGSLYGITANGELFEIDTLTGKTTTIYQFEGQGYNSLTTSGEGIMYATGDKGLLWSYNKIRELAIFHGKIGYRATGDLTFYKGKLYVAVNDDRIVQVDISRPQWSEVVIDADINGEIFGIVSYSSNCDSINCYAVSSGTSDIYQIDFDSRSLHKVCDLNIEVGGGASTYEFYGSSPIHLGEIKSIPPTCNHDDGSITIQASGGVGTLSYSINGNASQPQHTFTSLNSGIYSIMISDANGCNISEEVILTNSDGPAIENLAITSPACGQANGIIEVAATGGIGTLLYSLDGLNFQSSPVFQHLLPGQYIITVQDAIGCPATDIFELVEQVSPTIENINVTPPRCDETTGSLNVVVRGGSRVKYSIDGVNFQDANSFNHLIPSSYMLTIRDEYGCRDSLPFQVSPATPISINQIDIVDPVCIAKDGEIHLTAAGGTGRILFSIDGIHFQSRHDFYNLEPGSYKVEIMDEIGCKAAAQVEISDRHVLKLEKILTDSSGCGDKKGSITLMASGDPMIFSINGNATQSSPTFTDLLSGVYEIMIEGKDGCRLDTSARVAQEKCPIYIPNTFSPNGDGVNDFFQLSTYDNFNVFIQQYLIFDRWGNLAYTAEGFPISSQEFWWDGISKKMNVSPGLFAYYIEVKYDDGATDIFKGQITLVK